jgi:hypothetical protein
MVLLQLIRHNSGQNVRGRLALTSVRGLSLKLPLCKWVKPAANDEDMSEGSGGLQQLSLRCIELQSPQLERFVALFASRSSS